MEPVWPKKWIQTIYIKYVQCYNSKSLSKIDSPWPKQNTEQQPGITGVSWKSFRKPRQLKRFTSVYLKSFIQWFTNDSYPNNADVNMIKYMGGFVFDTQVQVNGFTLWPGFLDKWQDHILNHNKLSLNRFWTVLLTCLFYYFNLVVLKL